MPKMSKANMNGPPPAHTTLVIPKELLVRLKIRAIAERTDVSALLCRLAEQYLKRVKDARP
jgi:hypothetical protein